MSTTTYIFVNEALLMSTTYICFCGRIRKICGYPLLSASLSGSVGCAVQLEIRRLQVPPRSRQHSFVETDHEIFSTVILSLPLIQERQLSVSGKRMFTILVNRFVLRFYGPVNPMGSCRVRSVYLTTRLLGRLSPLSG